MRRTWKVVVTPRSIDLSGLGLDQSLTSAGIEVFRVEGGPLDSHALARVWADADAAILGLDAADADAISAGRRLKVIARYGAGTDNVDIVAASERGILVTNTPTAPAIAVAEHTIAMTLALVRRLPGYLATPGAPASTAQMHELAALTFGLVGYGRIGREVARRAVALGMRVLFSDPNVPARPASSEPQSRDLDALLREADVISLHVPLTEITRFIIGRDQLALMKPGALLINAARGGLIDEDALAAALLAGRLGGAALDVRNGRPGGAPDPLFGVPNTIVTPHVASRTVESTARMAREAVDAILAVRRGLVPPTAINAPAQ